MGEGEVLDHDVRGSMQAAPFNFHSNIVDPQVQYVAKSKDATEY